MSDERKLKKLIEIYRLDMNRSFEETVVWIHWRNQSKICIVVRDIVVWVRQMNQPNKTISIEGIFGEINRNSLIGNEQFHWRDNCVDSLEE